MNSSNYWRFKTKLSKIYSFSLFISEDSNNKINRLLQMDFDTSLHCADPRVVEAIGKFLLWDHSIIFCYVIFFVLFVEYFYGTVLFWLSEHIFIVFKILFISILSSKNS